MKRIILALFKVPPEPEPPAGLASSIRVFRASRNLYWLNLSKWGLGQAGALAGIILFFSVDMHVRVEPQLELLLKVGELVGLVGWALQLPVTFLLVRFDYEMRWYIVTDRSLRIRHGIQQIREMTMTFANIQQITIHQGPLQRLLGISDLQVRTAGGGDGESDQKHGTGTSMHVGFFRGVDNAEAIRDLILERLRRYRDSGLGDPDDQIQDEGAKAPAEEPIIQAANELLEEARALRALLAKENRS